MTAPAVRWLRWGAWALLAMVLGGLAVLWVATGRSGRAEELPRISRLPGFDLVDRTGEPVTRQTLAGRPWVADFVFTRCQLSCPLMSAKMAELGGRLPKVVRRVTVTVDPEHDTPEVLADYARSFSAAGGEWRFLTGPPEEVRRLVVEGFKLGLAAAPEGAPGSDLEPITHSTRFALVDAAGWIRGYYDSFEPGAVARLVRDARALAASEG